MSLSHLSSLVSPHLPQATVLLLSSRSLDFQPSPLLTPFLLSLLLHLVSTSPSFLSTLALLPLLSLGTALGYFSEIYYVKGRKIFSMVGFPVLWSGGWVLWSGWSPLGRQVRSNERGGRTEMERRSTSSSLSLLRFFFSLPGLLDSHPPQIPNPLQRTPPLPLPQPPPNPQPPSPPLSSTPLNPHSPLPSMHPPSSSSSSSFHLFLRSRSIPLRIATRRFLRSRSSLAGGSDSGGEPSGV